MISFDEVPNLNTLHHSIADRLPMWTIYQSPVDYPGQFVARMFVTLPTGTPTNLIIVGESLDAVRKELPNGLVCIPRDPSDPFQVVETWI